MSVASGVWAVSAPPGRGVAGAGPRCPWPGAGAVEAVVMDWWTVAYFGVVGAVLTSSSYAIGRSHGRRQGRIEESREQLRRAGRSDADQPQDDDWEPLPTTAKRWAGWGADR